MLTMLISLIIALGTPADNYGQPCWEVPLVPPAWVHVVSTPVNEGGAPAEGLIGFVVWGGTVLSVHIGTEGCVRA